MPKFPSGIFGRMLIYSNDTIFSLPASALTKSKKYYIVQWVFQRRCTRDRLRHRFLKSAGLFFHFTCLQAATSLACVFIWLIFLRGARVFRSGWPPPYGGFSFCICLLRQDSVTFFPSTHSLSAYNIIHAETPHNARFSSNNARFVRLTGSYNDSLTEPDRAGDK